MRRWYLLPLLATLAILFLPRPSVGQEEDPPDPEERPKVMFAPLADPKDTKMGTWHYVAKVGDRVVGRLMIKYWLDEEEEQSRKRYVEEEWRVCALGTTHTHREYDFTKTIPAPSVTQQFKTKLGAYEYVSNPTIALEGQHLRAKCRIEIKIGGVSKQFESEKAFAQPGLIDPIMSGKIITQALYAVGSVRLLPRLSTDLPAFERTFLFMEIPEPRRNEDGIDLVMAESGVEPLQVGDKTEEAHVFTLKSAGEVRAKYWLIKKAKQVIQFMEKFNPRVEVMYVPAASGDAAGKEVAEKAAKWGAEPNDPQAIAIHWLKAVLAGDQAGVDKLVDQAKVDAYPVAEDKKSMLALPELKKIFTELPSEQLFRWLYETRDKGNGRTEVMLQTIPGLCILAVEKSGDALKIVGIDPPPKPKKEDD